LGAEALLVKLAGLARKKATIMWRRSGFLSFPFINPCSYKKASPVQRKKKNPPSFVGRRARERPILLLFIHQIQNQKPISFHFFFNKCKGNRGSEGPIFLPLHLLKRERERNLNVLPLEKKLSHTKLLA
jgi:hypothetical protein